MILVKTGVWSYDGARCISYSKDSIQIDPFHKTHNYIIFSRYSNYAAGYSNSLLNSLMYFRQYNTEVYIDICS